VYTIMLVVMRHITLEQYGRLF